MDLDHAKARLTPWFAARLNDSSAHVTAFEKLSGGLVNAIHCVTVTSHANIVARTTRYILRWDPITGPQAPYDMPAQFHTYAHLNRTTLPVPAALWLETDPAILGRDFWVGAFVEAETIGRLIHPGEPFAEQRMASFMAMLVRIHDIDWRAAGLHGVRPLIEAADLHRLIERETPFLDGLPTPTDRRLFEHTRQHLKASAPASFTPCLAHGDCSLSNFMFRAENIVAVIDWDLSMITDRMLDIAYYCALLFRFDPDIPHTDKDVRRADFIARYCVQSGASPATLPFWELYVNYHNALSWTRAGWSGPVNGYAPYKARLQHLLESA